jgi:hypothetical protein
MPKIDKVDCDNFTNERFQEDTDAVWIMRLESSFYNIREEIYKKLKKDLKAPSFAIKENLTRAETCGTWSKSDRIISLKRSFIKNYEWNAIEFILRHEIAHMIVDEIFAFDNSRPHGEAFKMACDTLGIDNSRLVDDNILNGFKGNCNNPIADKVRKLMVHGNDKACSKEEAEVFLEKAQELMIRHNIKMVDVCGSERFFVKRPVGPTFERRPTWLWMLGQIVMESCNVKAILIEDCKQSRLEIYGEPNNLDVAEYIFNALLVQGTYLYNSYLKNVRDIRKTEIEIAKKKASLNNTSYKLYLTFSPKPSSGSFLCGLFNGYYTKTNGNKKVVLDKIQKEDGAIIMSNDKLLNEMYNKSYNVRNGSSRRFSLNSHYYAGNNAGKNLTLAKPVSGSRKTIGILNG